MMLLHQRLVLHLDFLQRRARTEPHHLQRLALGVKDLSRLGLGRTARPRPPPSATIELAEYAEGVEGAVKVDGRRPPAAATRIGAHFPGRTMAGQRILLVARHGFSVHPRKEVVGLVVFANVVETEVPIFPTLVTPLGRPVGPPVLATGPFAHGGFLAGLRVLLRARPGRLDANTVK